MLELNAKGKRVLIIPDLHMPYHHQDAMKFLRAIKYKYLEKNSLVINLGDEIDAHAISFHDSDCELFAAGEELEQAKRYLSGLEQLYPKMFILESNHGSLYIRRMKKHGIPISILKPMHEILGVSKKWTWHEDILLDTKMGMTYLCHGKTSGYGKLCKEMGCNAIQGHFHGKFELTWHTSSLTSRYNLFSGCLIDRESMAFAYGKNHLPKPILGACIISKEGYPRLIKMDLDKQNRWTGKLP